MKNYHFTISVFIGFCINYHTDEQPSKELVTITLPQESIYPKPYSFTFIIYSFSKTTYLRKLLFLSYYTFIGRILF